VKEKKIKLEAAKSKIMMGAIHDTYKVYHRKQFAGWNTESNADVLNMIRLLRQKKIEKDAEAESHKLGDREIEIFNQLEARADPDKERYNQQIYEPYLKKFVNRGANMNKDMYRLPEMIKPNYVTPTEKKMIDDKYRRGEFNIKSDEEIKKLYEVTENVFNHMEDPQDSLNTVSARTYNRNLPKKLYEISNNVDPQQYQNIVAENIKIENENSLNVPSSSFSDLDSFKKEGDDELNMAGYGSDESETENETDISGGESGSDILPEIPFQAIQDNNSNSSHAQPRDFLPHPSDESLVRKMLDNQNSKDPVLSRFK
jgi:hypothetical protein